jgi:hypothetical protein
MGSTNVLSGMGGVFHHKEYKELKDLFPQPFLCVLCVLCGSSFHAFRLPPKKSRPRRRLADNPNTEGDFVEQDETRRAVQVKVVGRDAVTFWADPPVCPTPTPARQLPTTEPDPWTACRPGLLALQPGS